jgi:hypothetical protein
MWFKKVSYLKNLMECRVKEVKIKIHLWEWNQHQQQVETKWRIIYFNRFTIKMKISQDLIYQATIQCKRDQDHLDQNMKMK